MMLRISVAALLICLLLTAGKAVAQNDYDVWCFGDHSGLDFRTDPPTPITSALNSWEGSANICDPLTGALLFYTDGEQVFNREHKQMPNGGGLLGSDNSNQPGLIIPMPGDKRRYYLFTSDAGDYDPIDSPNVGIHYSIIDMSLDGGRGDVVTKNVPLLALATEKLTAVRHADGCSWWVICHGWKDDAFHAYLVNDQGVAPAVRSNVGTVHDDPPTATRAVTTIGYMKPSLDGRRLAVAIYGLGLVQLFDFDDRTGAVSNPISIPMGSEPYGVSFSPDDTKLYISCQPNALFQLDLADPDPNAIRASRTLITDQVDPIRPERYSALQLAPDGKIYHCRSQTRWLAAIRNPNGKGLACDYQLRAVDLGVIARLGLPNLIDGFFLSGTLTCGGPVVSFTPGDTIICSGNCLTFTDASTNNPTSWIWTFQGAVPATSSDRNPVNICFPAPGRYRVELVASNERGAGRMAREIVVSGRGDLKAHIDREYKVMPGDTFTVPLTLDAPIDSAGLRQLSFSLGWNAGMLRLDSLLMGDGLLAGWRLDSIVYDRGKGRAYGSATAPNGETLRGAGKLFDLRFVAYLGQSDTSSIHFNLASAGNACLGALAEPGFAAIELCDAHNRLIEITGSSYTLDQNRPNPFNPSTEIPFSIGLDGHVTITVHDILGRKVATLVDGEMKHGAHVVTWDASAQPSGLYYYRIVSGEWGMVREMSLVK